MCSGLFGFALQIGDAHGYIVNMSETLSCPTRWQDQNDAMEKAEKEVRPFLLNYLAKISLGPWRRAYALKFCWICCVTINYKTQENKDDDEDGSDDGGDDEDEPVIYR